MLRYSLLNKEIAITIFAIVFLLPSVFTNCPILQDDFDSQMSLVWMYASEKGLLPYVDIFYPYGVIPFFKNASSLFSIVDLLAKVLVILGFFRMICAIFRSNWYQVTAFIFLMLLINFYVTFDVFVRYGALVIFTFYILEFIRDRTIFNRYKNFILGFIAGLFTYFYLDLAISAIGIYLVCLASNFYIKMKERDFKILKSVNYLNTIVIFILGFVLSISGFFFIYDLEEIPSVIESIKNLAYVNQYAKVPFPPTLLSIDNIFVIGFGILALSSLSYKLFIERTKLGKVEFVQVSILLPLFVLEQKNVLRSIDWQLTFLGLLLFYSVISNKVNKFEYRKLAVFTILNLIILITFLTSHGAFHAVGKKQSTVKYSTCTDGSVEEAMNSNYGEVYRELKSQDSKIHSFPADPIFYVMFDQLPPYYPNIYDASFQSAQESRIDYINKNNVNFIVLDIENIALQDSVPDFIRGRYEFKFLTTHFAPYKKIGNFLILKRQENPDFFSSSNLEKFPDLRKFLNVNMGSIPRTEMDNSSVSDEVIIFHSIPEANNYISSSNLNTRVDLFYKSRDNAMSYLSILTSDMKKTTVHFMSCKDGCLIKSENVPLLYEQRVLKVLESSSDMESIGIIYK